MHFKKNDQYLYFSEFHNIPRQHAYLKALDMLFMMFSRHLLDMRVVWVILFILQKNFKYHKKVIFNVLNLNYFRNMTCW